MRCLGGRHRRRRRRRRRRQSLAQTAGLLRERGGRGGAARTLADVWRGRAGRGRAASGWQACATSARVAAGGAAGCGRCAQCGWLGGGERGRGPARGRKRRSWRTRTSCLSHSWRQRAACSRLRPTSGVLQAKPATGVPNHRGVKIDHKTSTKQTKLHGYIQCV